MKSYFLFEGSSSEPQVYPYWLSILLPNTDQYTIDSYELFKACDTGLFFISGEGYPSVLNRIENSIQDIQEIGDVDYFFVVIDCDESTVRAREEEIISAVENFPLSLTERTRLVPLIQNRCFESMLLGNRGIVSRQSSQSSQLNQESPLVKYINYFDVSVSDPELMGNYNDNFNHAQFHADYLRKASVAKRIRYSKSNCEGVMNNPYLESLISRYKRQGHISSFGRFISIINEIRDNTGLPHI